MYCYSYSRYKIWYYEIFKLLSVGRCQNNHRCFWNLAKSKKSNGNERWNSNEEEANVFLIWMLLIHWNAAKYQWYLSASCIAWR